MSMVAMGSGEFRRWAELEDGWSNTHVVRAPPVFSKVMTTREATLLHIGSAKDLGYGSEQRKPAATAPPKGHRLVVHAQNVLLL